MNLLSNDQGQNHLARPVDHELLEIIKASKAFNTRRGYRSDWQHFEQWCLQHGHQPLPADPETVAVYLKEMMKNGYTTPSGERIPYKISSLERRLVAISKAHQVAGFKNPPTRDFLVRETMQGIRRILGKAQRRKTPIEIETLRQLVAVQDDSLIGLRNRALLVIGFTGAFRRSELVGIDVEHIEFRRDGLVILLPRSKTDQEGEGYKVGLPFGSNPATCPVRSLQDWLAASGISSGPVFRRIDRHGRILNRLTPQSVRLIVQDAAKKAGLNPDQFAGHSLRAGFVTTAHLAGKNERSIMKQTRHRSVKVLRTYIREADIFQDNAASGIGL